MKPKGDLCMAKSILDFTRPEADSLVAWYRRPTEEIQRAKQLEDAARFSELGVRARQADGARQSPDLVGIDAVKVQYMPATPISSALSDPRKSGRFYVADATRDHDLHNGALGVGAVPQNSRPASSEVFCSACHRPSITPLPPSLTKPPSPTNRPWGVFPKSPWARPPYLPPPTPKKNPQQCAMQNMIDSRKCVQQPNKVAREMCWESAAEREAYCIKSGGEVGYPTLFTHD